MIKVGSEREIKFDTSLRKKLFDFDLSNYETVQFAFKNKQYKIYKNFNLSIFTDSYCNADCKFCCAKLRYEQEKIEFSRNQNYFEDYFKRLDALLAKVRPLNPSISITGGEPTLSVKFARILELLDKYDFRKKVITTNGSNLLCKAKGSNKTCLELLNECRFDHLNISRTSYDDVANNTEMRFNNEDHTFSNADMETVVELLKKMDSKMRIRMSCILLNRGISSLDEIKKYVDFYKKLGVDNFVFRDLMVYDEKTVNKCIMEYYKEKRIDLYDLYEKFDADSEFKKMLNILGYYYYTEIFEYNGCTVATEKADLQKEYEVLRDEEDSIYELIFHPNGNLCASWTQDEKVIEYEA